MRLDHLKLRSIFLQFLQNERDLASFQPDPPVRQTATVNGIRCEVDKLESAFVRKHRVPSLATLSRPFSISGSLRRELGGVGNREDVGFAWVLSVPWHVPFRLVRCPL